MSSSFIIIMVLFFLFGGISPEAFHTNDYEEHDSCVDDNDCKDLPGRICIDYICICGEQDNCTVVREEIELVSRLGGHCKHNHSCLIDNAICLKNECTCRDNFLSSESGKLCLEVADELGAECHESIQCSKNIQHSSCINSSCSCLESAHQVNGDCVKNKVLGDSCISTLDCNINFSECKKGKCICTERYVQHESTCLLTARDILSPCTEDIQCNTTLGNQSACVNSACQCQDSARFDSYNKRCVTSGCSLAALSTLVCSLIIVLLGNTLFIN